MVTADPISTSAPGPGLISMTVPSGIVELDCTAVVTMNVVRRRLEQRPRVDLGHADDLAGHLHAVGRTGHDDVDGRTLQRRGVGRRDRC